MFLKNLQIFFYFAQKRIQPIIFREICFSKKIKLFFENKEDLKNYYNSNKHILKNWHDNRIPDLQIAINLCPPS